MAVSVMCNLSQGIKESGIAIGEANFIINMHKKGYTVEEISKYVGLSVEEVGKYTSFSKEMNVMSKRKAVMRLIFGCFLLSFFAMGIAGSKEHGMGNVYAAKKGKVYLKKASGTVKQGKTLKITVTKKKGVKIVKKTFTSTKKKIATVSSSGKIKGVKPGKATIKAKITYKIGKKAKKYTKTLKYTITVKKKSSSSSKNSKTEKDKTTEDKNASTEDSNGGNSETADNPSATTYPVTIKTGQSVYTVKEGETIQLSATVTPNPKNPNQAVNLEWSTTSGFIGVTTDGRVTGKVVYTGTSSGYRVTVKDTVSGSSASCFVNVSTGNPYEAKYDYDVVLLNDLYLGGSLGSYETVFSFAYIKTKNPGDRYFAFEISGSGTEDIIFHEYNQSNLYDLVYSDINIKKYDNSSHYFTHVDNGFLKELDLGIPMGADEEYSWNIWDEAPSKEIYAKCGGKITLNLYEYNPDTNIKEKTSDTYKKALVWSQEVNVYSFYDELDDWLQNELFPAALEGKTYTTNYEKLSLIINYMRNEYFMYPNTLYVDNEGNPIELKDVSPFTTNKKLVGLLSEVGSLWEHKRINSEGSPLLGIRIGEMVGCPVSIYSHSAIKPINGDGEPIECCPNGFADNNTWYKGHLPEKHNIDYFLKLYGKEE